MNDPSRRVEILMVEDNATDVLLAREALDSGVFNRLHVVDNGDEAMHYLRRHGQYRDAPRPDLVLLDLNLPRRSGQEVLAELKADADLKLIPVVVSHAEEDIVRAYAAHANCYVLKSLDFAKFHEALRAMEHFWLGVARLPRSAAAGGTQA